MADDHHLCAVTLRWAAKRLEELQREEKGITTGAGFLARKADELDEAFLERALELYHFGCWREPGHYTHGENGRSLDFNHIGPWSNIDGLLAPGGHHRDVEGAAMLHHYQVSESTTWTALGFWDRSVDERGACNTAFFIAAERSFAEMCELIEERYAFIWKRLKPKPFLVKTLTKDWYRAYGPGHLEAVARG